MTGRCERAPGWVACPRSSKSYPLFFPLPLPLLLLPPLFLPLLLLPPFFLLSAFPFLSPSPFSLCFFGHGLLVSLSAAAAGCACLACCRGPGPVELWERSPSG